MDSIEGAAAFNAVWNSNDIKHIRHKICEGIVGGRWETVIEEKMHTGSGTDGAKWVMSAQKRKDIYPLVGGKHKKWFIFT